VVRNRGLHEPVMTASLEAAAIPVEIVPVHPKMGALVKVASQTAAAVLVRKRATFDIGNASECV